LASLAARSNNPVLQVISLATNAAGLALYPVADLAAILGRGVRGRIDDLYQLGNRRLIEKLELCSETIDARLYSLELQAGWKLRAVGPASFSFQTVAVKVAYIQAF